MANPSKALGTKWEVQVVAYLKFWWPKIARRVTEGRFDKGDILNGPENWTLELKNTRTLSLPEQMRQAVVEARNNGHDWYAVVKKNRRGKFSSGKVEDGYFILPLHLGAKVMQIVERWEAMPNECRCPHGER